MNVPIGLVLKISSTTGLLRLGLLVARFFPGLAALLWAALSLLPKDKEVRFNERRRQS